ncbi:MAG TPA: hypothetical protein VEA78_02675 [Acidimicrobiales bacterium]|nr:hypothetical protein [Acidimicrobiales bacterium]
MSPTSYAIRVAGHLDRHWTTRLGDIDIAHNDDGTTTITTEAADQAQLHGLLNGLRDIGAVLIDLQPAHSG